MARKPYNQTRLAMLVAAVTMPERERSPATSPPPKLLKYAQTLGPRGRGTRIFKGLAAQDEVTALWPEMTSVRRWPRPLRISGIAV